ncbi:hypothetical protein [Mucilaginibacter conchicola]|nr:hypothetical protein [Mucilaginibacter conchicola]
MKILAKYGILHLTLFICLSFFLIWLTGRLILTPDFYERSGHTLTDISDRGNSVLELMQKWIYITSGIYLILKLLCITLILQTALFLNSYEIPVSRVFRVVVCAEFLFLIPAGVKIATFSYFYPNGTLLNWHQYYIFSALSFFKDVPADWYYALQSFNLFEILYWFVLGYGIMRITGLNYDRSLHLVAMSYVPSLLIWIVCVTFFTLLMFPSAA